MSDSLWPHTLQYTRFLYPSLSPRVFSNTCPLSQWCHPTTSSSVTPFTSCSQSFSASGPFPMYWFFTLGGQSIGSSASASVLLMWFPLGLTGLISLQSKGLPRVFCSTTIQKLQFFSAQPPLWSLRCTWSNYKNHWQQPWETPLMPPQLPFLYSSLSLPGGDARNPVLRLPLLLGWVCG